MAANDLSGVDLTPGSKKMLLASLLQRSAQPNPSLGGTLGNALALGLMGLYEGQDEKQMLNLALQKDAATKAAVDNATAPTAPAPAPTAAPAPVSQTPAPALAAALSPDLDGKITEVASKIGVAPAAVKSVIGVESNFNPRASTGSYNGLTQIGPQTFAEAPGGRLAGMSYDEYRSAPAPRQLDAYPAYLDQYRFKDQMAQNGIDVSKLPPDKQFAVLQGMQFAPNAQNWKAALAQGNLDVPTTNTRQAGALGNTSINAMAGSRYGQQAVAQAAPAQAPAQLPMPPQIAEFERNAMAAKQAGDGRAYQFWVQQATSAREGYLKSLQDIQVEQQKKLNVPPEKFTYDNREFTRDVRTGEIREITPRPQGGSSLNSYQAKERNDLRQEIMTTPQFKNIAQVAPVYKSMLDAAGKDDRASDLNLVYGMAKLMDPGSVVREGEVGMAQAVGTLPQQLQSAIMSQLQGTGRLSPEVRAALMEQAHSRMQAYTSEYDAASQLYGRNATSRGLNPDDVIPKFGPFEKYAPPPAMPMPTREQALDILRQRMQQQGR